MNHEFTPTSIMLVDGQAFDYLEPEKTTITLFNISHGLSHVCRYAGQCRWFYSVAEHSVHVSRLVPPEMALMALVHDASEAFLGDVTTPLKKKLPFYREVEHRLEAHIARSFGLAFPFPPEIKQADLAAFACEQPKIMFGPVPAGYGRRDLPPAANFKPLCLDPYAANLAFNARFFEIVQNENHTDVPYILCA